MTVIEHEFIFCNDVCYNIQGTQDLMYRLYHFDNDDGLFSETNYQSIQGKLSQWKFVQPTNDMIVDVRTGVYIPFDYWLSEYGIQENIAHWIVDDPFADDDLLTIATFDMTYSSSELDEDECISDDEEDEICEVVGILFDMSEDKD